MQTHTLLPLASPLSTRSAPTRPSSSKVTPDIHKEGGTASAATNRANSAPRMGRSSTLPKLNFSRHQSMMSVFSDTPSNTHRAGAGGETGRGSHRVVTTIELMKNPQGPPLDYSFLEIRDIEELKTVLPLSGFRKQPPDTVVDQHGEAIANPLLTEWRRQKAPAEGTVTQGLKLSNNQLSEVPYKSSYIFREIMEKPHHLRWIDLSFNNLTEIPAVLGFYAHLTTVYLHANQLQQPTDALVLAGLRELKALTMHGNPCEKADNYRLVVLAACVDLKKLDFASVTKADREKASMYAKSRKHRALLASLNTGPGKEKENLNEAIQVGLRQPQGKTIGGPGAAGTLARQ